MHQALSWKSLWSCKSGIYLTLSIGHFEAFKKYLLWGHWKFLAIPSKVIKWMVSTERNNSFIDRQSGQLSDEVEVQRLTGCVLYWSFPFKCLHGLDLADQQVIKVPFGAITMGFMVMCRFAVSSPFKMFRGLAKTKTDQTMLLTQHELRLSDQVDQSNLNQPMR